VVTKLFNDERSAAFWAQGAAKGGGLPCLVCTSGTAATNYLPAVAEAALAGIPLLVLTTDRPFELHDAKANQTLPQRDLFSPFAPVMFDIPAPEQRLFLHALLADLDQAVFEMRRSARPVHLNLAYRKPFVEETFTVATLPPEEVDELAHWSAKGTPYCAYLQPQLRLTTPDTERLVDRLSTARHMVCVAGPLAPTRATAALRMLATRLGAPLLADINSGLRCDGHQTPVLALYNLYLRGAVPRLPPADLVLYCGDRIVSEPLREYLAAQRTEFILCSSYPLRQDAVENEFIYPTLKVWGDPAVFLSASLIFREADYFVPCLPKRLWVGANRGATGIDGVLSSGIGFGEGLHKPCTVLIGDQALLHDLNALALLACASVPVYVIVINNHSGAIFHFFDLGAPGERLRNPHPWSFRGVAENFNVAYVCPSSTESFVAAYQEAQTQRRSTVFELLVNGEVSVRLFQAASTAL
jgi:2-succinyl-5-enolpyruvyl-6-hydroxy-3-cyclohexene-1-carboxylate synthase